ncbi:unnamed protein product [Ilex paraguariensis]|uniref:C2H2-type domain-containing protein n=1 Tax=Ilex paraguariensis TaxID=185542 RepID=A0ABC8UZM1_9AQUA
MVDVTKYVPPPPEKPSKTPKAAAVAHGSASSDRPYACPYDGCEKAYIHEYKLNLHLRRDQPGHFPDENAKNAQSNVDNEMDEASDQDAYGGKCGNGKIQKQSSRPKPNLKLPPSKLCSAKALEEDSEETEEDPGNVENGRMYGENNEDDDEETEYED